MYIWRILGALVFSDCASTFQISVLYNLEQGKCGYKVTWKYGERVVALRPSGRQRAICFGEVVESFLAKNCRI